MIRDRMKKWILPFMAAALLMQGCADTGAAGTGTAVETAGEEHSEGEARSTILEEKLEKEAEKHSEESPQEESAGVSFTDDIGRNVTVESHDRVVTLIGSFTDIWLLAGGEVVGAANDSWDSFDLDLGADVVNIGSDRKSTRLNSSHRN